MALAISTIRYPDSLLGYSATLSLSSVSLASVAVTNVGDSLSLCVFRFTPSHLSLKLFDGSKGAPLVLIRVVSLLVSVGLILSLTSVSKKAQSVALDTSATLFLISSI